MSIAFIRVVERLAPLAMESRLMTKHSHTEFTNHHSPKALYLYTTNTHESHARRDKIFILTGQEAIPIQE
jgi:hypothetical protein